MVEIPNREKKNRAEARKLDGDQEFPGGENPRRFDEGLTRRELGNG